MPLPISILDVTPVPSGSTSAQALRNSVDLARFADGRGFTRHWFAEHHNSGGIASTTPEIMIARIAHETSHIRVGSGGVMLPNHAPLKVAESFRMLEALYPSRIDLGIGRAPGTDMMTALALRRTQENLNADNFPQELAELLAFANGAFPAEHPFRAVTAYPNDVPLPPIWLLGSSGYSSQMSAELGMGFAFAHHINASAAIPAMKVYRDHFEPSAAFPKPHAILAVSIIAADTDEEANDLALSVQYAFLRIQSGRSGPLASPAEVKAYALSPYELNQMGAIRERHFVGSPSTISERLLPLIEKTQADELMILSMVHDHEARKHSYELMAELFDVQPVIAQVVG
ncbi:MAG: LLM class flavin-dependent oxidoreductase [Chloroflexi bacterium]|nr:LLM class flavin-dependent oxidoreductase [Chloroflexota bacterium]MCC6894353.1 LLM class flavin-dependent oxidoreductase [Anaerolineae bacterium]